MIWVLLGPPGAGKGTQSRLLAAETGAKIIEVGAYLRRKRQDGTQLGKFIQSLIDQGNNVPGDILMEVIGPDLLKYAPTGVIIDNFLRDKTQVESWQKFAAKHNLKVGAVIHLLADLQTCWKRVLKRAQLEKRADDNYQAFRKRYQGVYQAHIKEVLSSFDSQVPIIEIDARPPIKEVYKNIVAELKKKGVWIRKSR